MTSVNVRVHGVRFALMAILLLLSSLALGQTAGRVVLAVGDVTLVRESQRSRIMAGADLRVGDLVATGPLSNAQLRFSDEGLIALKPESELKIEQYNFSGSPDAKDVAVFRLVKGGFRTLTGQIGKLNREQYEVKTSQATIGIRGTHYALQICPPQQCLFDNGETARPGLYGGVYEGRIVVFAGGTEFEYGANEFFFVPDDETQPRAQIEPSNQLPGSATAASTQGSGAVRTGSIAIRLLGPPAFLTDQLVSRRVAITNAPADVLFPKVPEDERDASGPLPPLIYTTTEDLARGSSQAGSIDPGKVIAIGSDRNTIELDKTTNPGVALVVDSAGRLLAFANANLNASVGTAQIVDTGIDLAGGNLNWGRWAGPGSTIVQNVGGELVNGNGGNLHYVYGTVATALPTSGQVSFAAVGGTRPTDSGTGAVGNLISGGTINVNFTTAQMALSGLTVGFPNATYTMGGGTSIVNGLFSTGGTGAAAGCSGNACQALVGGNFVGFLAGPGGQGIGLDYFFNTLRGAVIEGAAAYRRN